MFPERPIVAQTLLCADASSKAAINNMTRELAIQWAIRGVRVNGLAPGYFPSEIHQSNAMPEEMKLDGGTGETRNVLDPVRTCDRTALELAQVRLEFVRAERLLVNPGRVLDPNTKVICLQNR